MKDNANTCLHCVEMKVLLIAFFTLKYVMNMDLIGFASAFINNTEFGIKLFPGIRIDSMIIYTY